jgi:predicted metal-binding membrane protein
VKDRVLTRPGVVKAASPLSLLRHDVRAAGLVVVLLLSAAALAWYALIRQAAAMAGMPVGPAQMGAAAFLATWVVMMVAMMFPTIAPMVLTYRLVSRRRGDGWWECAAFVAGYLLVWSLIGLVPTAAFLGFQDLAGASSVQPWLPYAAGVALAVAGLYQFTPVKRACLKRCRTPLDFVLEHDFGGGSRSALRAGIYHGTYCLGCCWALMLVLVVVGFMNLTWMAALASVFLVEKNLRHGPIVNRVVGGALVLLGAAVALHPALLPLLAGGLPSAVSNHI